MSDHHSTSQYVDKKKDGWKTSLWNPRTKLISGLIYVFGVISLSEVTFLGVAFIFAILYAGWGGLSLGQLMKKLAVLIPFLGLMSLPLVFGAGIPPTPDRIEFAALIVLKALTAMTFTLFVFINQPVEEMLEALEHLKMPRIITTTIYLAYRYGFLFVQDMQTTLKALKSRLFQAQLSRYSLKIYGELFGGLFIKSINRSETVYRAMASRCFQGEMPIGKPRKITGKDWIRAGIPVLFMITLIMLDQGVLG
ncbi:cobalt/nickel transport system permease protein [Tindallia magadiensis]|uniref:Cobalt/nickel transport system permease protein n=1 Tax=Tindallia magadiensis TaxID=69895 RepID=A0A1I3DCP8_9FIRM|nr:cobalt ECF transporter T component CbiQ [Tindallia magadiensis]SFH84483.1 cobalt/nickel transport system permease protein [Tindallia magadiensis]